MGGLLLLSQGSWWLVAGGWYHSAMLVSTEYVDLTAPQSPMRMFVAWPHADGKYPGILCYSDIFQLSGPMLRACTRLAGYGFVIAAPEIYHRIEPLGAAIP